MTSRQLVPTEPVAPRTTTRRRHPASLLAAGPDTRHPCEVTRILAGERILAAVRETPQVDVNGRRRAGRRLKAEKTSIQTAVVAKWQTLLRQSARGCFHTENAPCRVFARSVLSLLCWFARPRRTLKTPLRSATR